MFGLPRVVPSEPRLNFIHYASNKINISIFRTKFFVVFAITSGGFLLGLFEFFVPLLELLPQENFIFISLTFLSVLLFYKVSESWINSCNVN